MSRVIDRNFYLYAISKSQEVLCTFLNTDFVTWIVTFN